MNVNSAVFPKDRVLEKLTLTSAPEGRAEMVVLELKNGLQFYGRITEQTKENIIVSDSGIVSGQQTLARKKVEKILRMPWVRIRSQGQKIFEGQLFRRGDKELVVVNISSPEDGYSFRRKNIVELKRAGGKKPDNTRAGDLALRYGLLFAQGDYSGILNRGHALAVNWQTNFWGNQFLVPRLNLVVGGFYFPGEPGLTQANILTGGTWQLPLWSNQLFFVTGFLAGPGYEKVSGAAFDWEWVISYQVPVEILYRRGRLAWSLGGVYYTSSDQKAPLNNFGPTARVSWLF